MLKILFIDLLFNAKRFFSEHLSFCKKYYIWFVYIVGVGFIIDGFDVGFIKAALREQTKEIDMLSSWSWTWYWFLVLLFGAPYGLLRWWIGGWWYKIRIKWSGAKRPDPFKARLIYISSSFVYFFPLIIVAIVNNFIFKTPWEACFKGSITVAALFSFWSLYVSYIGVINNFDLNKWKARLWFIILPIVLMVTSTLLTMGIYIWHELLKTN